MTTFTASPARNIIVKDPNGHRYSIPETLEEDFRIMCEAIQLVEWGSDEWLDRNDELNGQFGQYMRG